MSEREERSEQVFTRLFGTRDLSAPDPHPEFMQMLRSIIFGDVFAVGDLDDQTRELITCTVLAAVQALPQLRAHAGAALNVQVSPTLLVEAMYQLAPTIGFPRTLNAVAVVSEVLGERGVDLPLPAQGSVGDEDRHERGRRIQQQLYGSEIAEAFAALPGPFATAVPDLLTDFVFGDLWTRGGLDIRTRELLEFVALAALGLQPQVVSHARGVLKAGNSAETVLAALVQAAPYMGLPHAINAIRVLRDTLAG